MDEDILVPLIVFSFVLALVWTILNHSKWKYRQKMEAKHGEGNSLRTSELKALMREAVEEANAPLLARIGLLEAKLKDLQTPRLMPASDDDRLDLPGESEIEEPMPASRRRVTDRP